MLNNYFKIAWRNITRQKAYTIINVLGLALGICACTVIYIISSYERSFDDFHPGKENIYRVMGDVTGNSGEKLHFGKLPPGVSQYGRKELSGITTIAGIIPFNAKISIPDRDKQAKHFDSRVGETPYLSTVISEPEYFDIFKYEWLAGNNASVLNEPFKVVLTESRAHQYFGSLPIDRIIGMQVVYEDSLIVSVAGIVKDWNKNTDLAFTDFISSSTLQSIFLKSRIDATPWGTHSMNTWTFAKLPAGTLSSQVNAQMASLVKKHADPASKLVLWLEPLSELHFNDNVIENPIRTASKFTLYSLMAIALFILLLAVINFINLSTAQSIRRAKEIGVRKVLGGSRKSLIFQILAETFLLTSFAVSVAMLLVKPVIYLFRSFIPDGLDVHFFDPSLIVFLILITLITTLLAGLYPAKVLSSHLPVYTLKGVIQGTGEKWLLRKGLIVFQFSVSLVFIIGSIVIRNQLEYANKKDRGFNADSIIMVTTPWGDSLSKIPVLAGNIKQMAGVSRVALQWVPPMTDKGRGRGIKFNKTDEKETGVVQIAGNEDLIPLYGIRLLAGRNLVHADSMQEIVINESLSRLMGYKKPEEAIGKTLYWTDKPYPVVGVVADFHSRSFHEILSPVCIVNRPDREGTIAIKLISKDKQSVKSDLLQIEKLWKQIYPANTFQYQFYDESLALLYEKDEQTATLVNASMVITIFISCIGLFGLALFTAQKRTKEISIRKVLGASVSNIVMMLSQDFVILIIIALFIASPVAWYFMNNWLQDFAYRINISWLVFVLAGLSAIVISLATVGFQAIKTAIASPVKNLRTE